MLAYATKSLETDKLYFLFRRYVNTEDSDEKFLLQADLEGDFVANASLKRFTAASSARLSNTTKILPRQDTAETISPS